MVALPIDIPTQKVAAYCRKWKIREFSLFASVLRDDFNADSDVDVLVTFEESARWGLWDVATAEEELAELMSRRVDLIDRKSVEQSENWIRRKSILDSARTIYAG